MAPVRDVAGIQIDEQPLDFIKHEWRFQRIGWVVMLVMVLAALAGAFGRGPIAHDMVGDPRTFSFEFDRVVRHRADTELTVTVGPGLQRDSVLRIFFNREYLSKLQVLDVSPQPNQSGESGDKIFFDFERTDVRKPARIVFHIQPQGYWHQSAKVGIAGVTTLEFGQLTLP